MTMKTLRFAVALSALVAAGACKDKDDTKAASGGDVSGTPPAMAPIDTTKALTPAPGTPTPMDTAVALDTTQKDAAAHARKTKKKY